MASTVYSYIVIINLTNTRYVSLVGSAFLEREWISSLLQRCFTTAVTVRTGSPGLGHREFHTVPEI